MRNDGDDYRTIRIVKNLNPGVRCRTVSALAVGNPFADATTVQITVDELVASAWFSHGVETVNEKERKNVKKTFGC